MKFIVPLFCIITQPFFAAANDTHGANAGQLIWECQAQKFYREAVSDGLGDDRVSVELPESLFRIYLDPKYGFFYANYSIQSTPVQNFEFAAVEIYSIDGASLAPGEYAAALNFMAKMSTNLAILGADHYMSYRVLDADLAARNVAIDFYKGGLVVGKVLYLPELRAVGICL